jgi:hypothetical protein
MGSLWASRASSLCLLHEVDEGLGVGSVGVGVVQAGEDEKQGRPDDS